LGVRWPNLNPFTRAKPVESCHHMNAASEETRLHLRAELEAARQEFHAMAAAVSEEAWSEPSNNPGWTNGQVLFHVLLGFLLVPPLARLLVVFGHLPGALGRAFARLLDLPTPFFHGINAAGPRGAARMLGRNGVIARFDRVHRVILTRLERVRPEQWTLAMAYPTRWDPRFRSEMRLEDLFHYPVLHLRHHRSQLRATQPVSASISS
jgi:hypothetical protein